MSMALGSARAQLPGEWQQWIATSDLMGVPMSDSIAVLVASGVDSLVAEAACREIAEDPVHQAGRVIAGRLNKLESMLTIRQQLRDLSSIGSEIERRRCLTRQEFLDDYYSANLPVLLEDTCNDWPALQRWQPQYLLDTIGSASVEVMLGRESDLRFEQNSNHHKVTMSFSDYVARVLGTSWGNDAYLVANNHLLENPSAAPLWRDFSIDTRYLDPMHSGGTVFLWFGPAGTITPLHHDVANVLFTQVVGQKVVTLISPLDMHCVYNDVAVYSPIDIATVDTHDGFPRFAQVRRFQVRVGPGDALFIPVGWWHHVEAQEISVSVSFTNFVFPNSYRWQHPGGTAG